MSGKRFVLILVSICALMLFILSACSCSGEAEKEIPEHDETNDKANFLLSVETHRDDELLFSMTAGQFIDCYNKLYCGDWGEDYLSPLGAWDSTSLETGIHSAHPSTLYEFSADESIWSMPTVFIYTPSDSDKLQEVCVNFDDHSFSETCLDQFESMCLYTLRVFFPQEDEEKLKKLYGDCFAFGYENAFQNEQGYEYGAAPYEIYHNGEIGFYTYFALGEWLHFCVIPVDGESIERFEQSGTRCVEI